jgi:signal transduction histidine kinase
MTDDTLKTNLRAATTGQEGRWPSLFGLAVNFLVCLTIATTVHLLTDDGWFLGNLFLSCAIGYSIYLAIWLGFRLFSPRVPSLVLVVSGIAIGLVAGLAITGLVLLGSPGYFLRGEYEVLALGVLFGVVATAGFMLLGDLWDVRGRLARAEREALARDKAMAEAELRVLQAQIEPHFLFNTLANVISHVDDDPARARRLLERLTSLLRTSLARTRAAAVTIDDELSVVRDYLEIQALRMDDRLTWEVEIAPGLGDARVPPLLVQPLVENAVLHGIEPRAEGGAVRVSVLEDGDGIVILVEDDGIGLGEDAGPPGTGLANVRERLEALHGDAARLDLTAPASGGVRAALHLPRVEAAT